MLLRSGFKPHNEIRFTRELRSEIQAPPEQEVLVCFPSATVSCANISLQEVTSSLSRVRGCSQATT